jgi:hypothetical protein
LLQGWIAVIECQACTDTLISEEGQLDFWPGGERCGGE